MQAMRLLLGLLLLPLLLFGSSSTAHVSLDAHVV
jgi:hypothetical protein